MYKYFLIIITSVILSNCSIKKAVNHHGVHFLEKKQENLIINTSNKNDVTNILGTPLTKSKFDNDLWIYIERKESNSGLLKLGKSQLIKNDVLIIEIDNYGILLNKTFYNMDDMNNIKFVNATTSTEFKKNSFIYNFLSSMRQKINDPLGVRAKKREEIRQR
jgi:outer membrane protein assembly factor BamE (lipoprotein component of BamABCDE complex)